jgi:Mg2+/citrate symporter
VSRDSGKLFGVAVLACLACFIWPILAVVGAIGIASLLGVLLYGIAGVITLAALLLFSQIFFGQVSVSRQFIRQVRDTATSQQTTQGESDD